MTKKRISEEQVDEMLFWYTFYDGNYGKVGTKVGRNRKVVRDIALKHNFKTKSHLMRNQVNKHFYGVDNPALARTLKMGLALMNTEELLLEEVHAYVSNKRRVSTRFRHMGDVVTVLKHVEDTMVHVTGEPNIRGRTLEEIDKHTAPEHKLTVENILDELSDEEKIEVRQRIIDNQREQIIQGKAIAVR